MTFEIMAGTALLFLLFAYFTYALLRIEEL